MMVEEIRLIVDAFGGATSAAVYIALAYFAVKLAKVLVIAGTIVFLVVFACRAIGGHYRRLHETIAEHGFAWLPIGTAPDGVELVTGKWLCSWEGDAARWEMFVQNSVSDARKAGCTHWHPVAKPPSKP